MSTNSDTTSGKMSTFNYIFHRIMTQNQLKHGMRNHSTLTQPRLRHRRRSHSTLYYFVTSFKVQN